MELRGPSLSQARQFRKAGLLRPGLGRLNDVGLVVADALKREGINARVAAATTAIEDDEAA